MRRWLRRRVRKIKSSRVGHGWAGASGVTESLFPRRPKKRRRSRRKRLALLTPRARKLMRSRRAFFATVVALLTVVFVGFAFAPELERGQEKTAREIKRLHCIIDLANC